jgi:hypothetical protein
VELTGIEPPDGDFEKPKPNADLTFIPSKSPRIVHPLPFRSVPPKPLPGSRVTAT